VTKNTDNNKNKSSLSWKETLGVTAVGCGIAAVGYCLLRGYDASLINSVAEYTSPLVHHAVEPIKEMFPKAVDTIKDCIMAPSEYPSFFHSHSQKKLAIGGKILGGVMLFGGIVTALGAIGEKLNPGIIKKAQPFTIGFNENDLEDLSNAFKKDENTR
jgi:hypothetical protein